MSYRQTTMTPYVVLALALIGCAHAAPWRCVQVPDATVCIDDWGQPSIQPPTISVNRPPNPCVGQSVVMLPPPCPSPYNPYPVPVPNPYPVPFEPPCPFPVPFEPPCPCPCPCPCPNPYDPLPMPPVY